MIKLVINLIRKLTRLQFYAVCSHSGFFWNFYQLLYKLCMKSYLGIFWRKISNSVFLYFLEPLCVYQHTVTQLLVVHRGNDLIKMSSHAQKYNFASVLLGIATGCPVLHHNDLAQRITLQFFMILYCTS